MPVQLAPYVASGMYYLQWHQYQKIVHAVCDKRKTRLRVAVHVWQQKSSIKNFVATIILYSNKISGRYQMRHVLTFQPAWDGQIF